MQLQQDLQRVDKIRFSDPDALALALWTLDLSSLADVSYLRQTEEEKELYSSLQAAGIRLGERNRLRRAAGFKMAVSSDTDFLRGAEDVVPSSTVLASPPLRQTRGLQDGDDGCTPKTIGDKPSVGINFDIVALGK
jgi:hypothetical protein